MSEKIEDFDLMSTREICCQLRISARTLERYRKRPSDSNPFLNQTVHTWGDPTNG